MKSTVSVERRGMVIEPSDESHKTPYSLLENQFFFNYPGPSLRKVKEELKHFWKRKVSGAVAMTLTNSTYPEAIAMPLDEGEFVDYRAAVIDKNDAV
jgi:hypothetical protein